MAKGRCEGKEWNRARGRNVGTSVMKIEDRVEKRG